MVFKSSFSALSSPSITRVMIMILIKNYFHEVIKYVNEREDEHETQTRESRTGLVNVLSLRNNCKMKSDPRIALITFQKIDEMYRDLKYQDTIR